MKSIWRMLVVAFMLGGWALSAAALHVIYTGRITLIPKERLSYAETYIDPRAWTLNDIASHPQVVQRMIETGKIDLLSHVAEEDNPKPLEEQIREAIAHGSAVEKETTPEKPPTTAPVTGV